MPRRNERAICILEACAEKQNSKKHGAVGCGSPRAHLVFDWSRWISEAAAGSPSLSRHARGWAPFTGGSRHRLHCHGPPSTRTCTVLTCEFLSLLRLFFSTDAIEHKSRHIVLRNIICSRFQAQNAAVKDTRCLRLFGFLLAFAPHRAARDGCALVPSLSSVSERSEQSSNIRSEDEAPDALRQTPPALKEWPRIASQLSCVCCVADTT